MTSTTAQVLYLGRLNHTMNCTSSQRLHCFVKSNGKITVEDDTDWEEEYGDDISSESQEAKPYFWEMSRYFQILVVKRVNSCISAPGHK